MVHYVRRTSCVKRKNQTCLIFVKGTGLTLKCTHALTNCMIKHNTGQVYIIMPCLKQGSYELTTKLVVCQRQK